MMTAHPSTSTADFVLRVRTFSRVIRTLVECLEGDAAPLAFLSRVCAQHVYISHDVLWSCGSRLIPKLYMTGHTTSHPVKCALFPEIMAQQTWALMYALKDGENPEDPPPTRASRRKELISDMVREAILHGAEGAVSELCAVLLSDKFRRTFHITDADIKVGTHISENTLDAVLDNRPEALHRALTEGEVLWISRKRFEKEVSISIGRLASTGWCRMRNTLSTDDLRFHARHMQTLHRLSKLVDARLEEKAAVQAKKSRKRPRKVEEAGMRVEE